MTSASKQTPTHKSNRPSSFDLMNHNRSGCMNVPRGEKRKTYPNIVYPLRDSRLVFRLASTRRKPFEGIGLPSRG